MDTPHISEDASSKDGSRNVDGVEAQRITSDFKPGTSAWIMWFGSPVKVRIESREMDTYKVRGAATGWDQISVPHQEIFKDMMEARSRVVRLGNTEPSNYVVFYPEKANKVLQKLDAPTYLRRCYRDQTAKHISAIITKQWRHSSLTDLTESSNKDETPTIGVCNTSSEDNVSPHALLVTQVVPLLRRTCPRSFTNERIIEVLISNIQVYYAQKAIQNCNAVNSRRCAALSPVSDSIYCKVRGVIPLIRRTCGFPASNEYIIRILVNKTKLHYVQKGIQYGKEMYTSSGASQFHQGFYSLGLKLQAGVIPLLRQVIPRNASNEDIVRILVNNTENYLSRFANKS